MKNSVDDLSHLRRMRLAHVNVPSLPGLKQRRESAVTTWVPAKQKQNTLPSDRVLPPFSTGRRRK